MNTFKSFISKLLDGMVNLPPVPEAMAKRSTMANIIIEREAEGLSIKIVLEDGTDFRYQRVEMPRPGDIITLKDVRIITDIIVN